MARSRWKFFFFSRQIWKGLFRTKFTQTPAKKKQIKLNTNTVVPKYLLNKYAILHKGSSSLIKQINKWMIGRKLGEFIFTRKPFFFPMKKSKKKRNLKR